MKTTFSTLWLILTFGLFACAPAPAALVATPEPATAQPTLTQSPVDTVTPIASVEPVETPTASPTQTSTPTASVEPVETSSVEPVETPTYAILRGKVNVEKVSCRYGPGAMYLYLYGMIQGATQDLIGRNDDGSWVLTRARGDTTACWVKTALMDLNGDILSVQPIHPDDYKLPMSPYYGPLTGVSAARNGDQVTVTWHPLLLRAGDDSLQTPYVLQVWVCRGGESVMESIGAYQTTVTVSDESGCAQPSRGRISAAEKHGYTKFVEIPWP